MAADGGQVNTQILDLVTDRAIDLLRLTARQQREAVSFLNKLEDDLAAQLARADLTGVSVRSRQAKRLEKLLAQVRETIRGAYRDHDVALSGELKELAEIEADFVANSVNQVVGVQIMDTGLTRGQLAAVLGDVTVQGAPVSEWWSRQAGDTLARFTDQMRLGIAQGETVGQLVRRIRGGTEKGEVVPAIMDVSRRHADALVRSATQAVSQTARNATYEANNDVLKGVAWVSTLDFRTTLGCAARDNKLYSIGDHQPIDHDLPWENGPGQRHWGCRSTSAPVVKSWRELGFDIDDLPASTRASMDGQVPQDTSFERWLNGKTSAEQDDFLGKGRANLWRDGKISFRELLDARGRELSIDELRGRAPIQPKRNFAYSRFKGVKKTADAERYLVENRISEAASLKGLSPAGISASVKAAHEVTERFELAPLKYMGPISRDTRFRYRRVKNANAAVFPSTEAMHLPTKFGNLKDAEQQIATKKRSAPRFEAERAVVLDASDRIDNQVRQRVENMNAGDYTWTITMDTADAERAKTMYHEFGHVLHMVDKRAGPKIDAFLAEQKPLAGGWNYLLSKYAGSNNAEYVAESFAVYMARPKAERFRIHPSLLAIFEEADLAHDN